MARDLFRLTFERFSQFDWATYRAQFLEELPFNLLRAAGSTHPQLQTLPGFAALSESLADVSREQWNNPELYPHLFALLKGSADIAPVRSIQSLLVHIGAVPLIPEESQPGFCRRRVPRPTVCRIDGEHCVEIVDAIVDHGIMAPFPIVYLPYPGLFDDVVGAGVYDGSAGARMAAHAPRMIGDAASALERYSGELYEGFREAIGTVGLTGEPEVAERSSYSSRMYYAGGIFSSLLQDNVPALVENLVHEYYHQRLWVWWSIEAPEDLPDESVTIQSPVTGMQKSVRVMLHAFLIYIGVCEFYRFALAHEQLPDHVAAWVGRRLAHLTNGSIELRARLIESLQPYPESLRLAQFLGDLMPMAEYVREGQG